METLEAADRSTGRGIIEALVEETNRARRAHGLRALSSSEDLAAAARSHAEDMLARRYFAHASPEGDEPIDRVQKRSPRAIVLGVRENIAKAEGTMEEAAHERARSVIDGWLGSKGHRENLLNQESTSVGFGIASSVRAGRLVEYTVQVLGIVAGSWQDPPRTAIRPPARWLAKLSLRVEFFLDDESRPRRSYRDPEDASVLWTGGIPLIVSREGRLSAVEIPRVEPGRYRILARRAGEKSYQELRKIKVTRRS